MLFRSAIPSQRPPPSTGAERGKANHREMTNTSRNTVPAPTPQHRRRKRKSEPPRDDNARSPLFGKAKSAHQKGRCQDVMRMLTPTEPPHLLSAQFKKWYPCLLHLPELYPNAREIHSSQTLLVTRTHSKYAVWELTYLKL